MAEFQNTISTFNQGISDDIRIQKKTVDDFAYSKNFDVFANIKKLIPQRELSFIASVNTNKIKPLIRLTTGYVAGLGVVVATTKPKIFISPNYDSSFTTWTAATNGESANTSGAITTFVEYTNKSAASYVYGFRGGSAVWRWKSDDSMAFTETFQSVSYTYTAQGIVHPADDVLYLPYDNKIASLNDTTWNATAMAGIPSNYIISSIVPWGNYLAIIGKPLNYGTTSRMWLWDRDSSLTTFTENIDLGEGVAFAAGNVEGNIIIAQIITKNFLPTIIKLTRYSGGTHQVFKQITTNATTALNADMNWSAVYNNRFYFSLDDSANTYCGLWSVGRYGVNYPYGVCIEKSADAIDVAGVSTSINAFLLVKDYWIMSIYNGTNYVVHTTNTIYFGTGIYETQKLSEGDITIRKSIESVSLAYESLPTGATLTLKARADATSTYKTIFTVTTAGEVFHEANQNESDGSAIASSYKEIQFRIESTGGAVPLALSYKGQILNQLSK